MESINNTTVDDSERKVKKVKSAHVFTTNDKMLERYVACMVLSGVGDAMGYKNGQWEFNMSGKDIHKEVEELGGIENLNVHDKKWLVSDDTVMHIATGEAIVKADSSLETLFPQMAKDYILSFTDMAGRAPGGTTAHGIAQIKKNGWNAVKFSRGGGGCGGSMRAMCIGLRYYGESERDNLIAVGIESGRMTHNHPTGFLGSLASAVFTAFAIEDVPIVQWGRKFIKEILPRAYAYINKIGRDVKEYEQDLHFFETALTNYLKLRDIFDEDKNEPKFPKNYDVTARDKYYKEISYNGWGGASGHDSVIIAYDAIIGSKGDWKELCYRGILHGGDNDSTGCISAAWFGSFFGFHNVPLPNYQSLEYLDRLTTIGKSLYQSRLDRENSLKNPTSINSEKKE